MYQRYNRNLNSIITLRELMSQAEDTYDEDTKAELLEELEEFHCDLNETLIPEDRFQDYIEGYFDETSDALASLPEVIRNNIDWKQVAAECESDYDQADFDGVTYLWRA